MTTRWSGRLAGGNTARFLRVFTSPITKNASSRSLNPSKRRRYRHFFSQEMIVRHKCSWLKYATFSCLLDAINNNSGFQFLLRAYL